MLRLLVVVFCLLIPCTGLFAQSSETLPLITADNARDLDLLGVVGVSTVTGSAWSPDGDWIAYTNDAGVFIVPEPDAGSGEQIAWGSAELPVFSPDGRVL